MARSDPGDPDHPAIFVCTGSDCRKNGSRDVLRALRDLLAERDLEHAVEARRCPCLDKCKKGPNALVWPDALLVSKLDEDDLGALVDYVAGRARLPRGLEVRGGKKVVKQARKTLKKREKRAKKGS